MPKTDSLTGSAPDVKIVVNRPPSRPQPTANRIVPSVRGSCAARMTASAAAELTAATKRPASVTDWRSL
jgi:hypothetical protein